MQDIMSGWNNKLTLSIVLSALAVASLPLTLFGMKFGVFGSSNPSMFSVLVVEPLAASACAVLSFLIALSRRGSPKARMLAIALACLASIFPWVFLRIVFSLGAAR